MAESNTRIDIQNGNNKILYCTTLFTKFLDKNSAFYQIFSAVEQGTRGCSHLDLFDDFEGL